MPAKLFRSGLLIRSCRTARVVMLAAPACIALSHAQAGPIPSPSLRIMADDLTTERFGEAVAIKGDIALIGAPGDSANGDSSGAVYAYHRQPDGSWMQETKLTPSDGAIDDLFGFSVDIVSQFAIIGAYRDNDNGADSGSAYVFRRDFSGVWVEDVKLVPLDGSTLDRFGYSVSIGSGFGGITACIGAYLDDAAGPDSGSVYFFNRDFGGQWSETIKLQGLDSEASDSFGWSVDIDGETAIVSAYLDDDLGNGAGAVYIFRQNLADEWFQFQKIHASDGFSTDNFGIAVALDGSLMVVGAYLEDENGAEAGAAYVFRFTGGSWMQEAKLLAPDGSSSDFFGRYVAIQGQRIVVAATGEDSAGLNAGAAYTYERIDNQWFMTKKLLSTNAHNNDEFGHAVAIDEVTALVGAWKEIDVTQTGAAYLFDLSQFGCPGDLNFDDQVDTSDLGILIGAFGTATQLADINGDGIVDTADLGVLISVFGMACTQ